MRGETPSDERRRQNPLITQAGLRRLRALRQHPHAPRWNHAAGDRLTREDLQVVRAFQRRLRPGRKARAPGLPPPALQQHVTALRERVLSFRERLPPGLSLETDWAAIPTVSREDIALRLEKQVPLDADLDRLIVFTTAGTTGHPLQVPHDPRATASYLPLLQLALERYGVRPALGGHRAACFLVGAQARTVTYATVLSFWGNAGFAKLNLNASEWPTPESPARYLEAFEPCFLTGDPISFAALMRLGTKLRPAALVSTAVAMNRRLKQRLKRHFHCPVIDWYSLTETGPIGYACPRGRAYHLLSHDVFVEAVDPEGVPVSPGQRGEIAVTGGRNPFLPLLRYRTGDWGRLDYRPCACGDPMPRLLDLEGREPVLFRATDGARVNPVDLSRVLRRFPLVQHEFTQRADGACEVVLRPLGSARAVNQKLLRDALRELLGSRAKITFRVDPRLGDRSAGGKVTPYHSDLLFED